MGKCKNTTYYSIYILHTGMTELVAKHVQVIEKQSIFEVYKKRKGHFEESTL